jgi:hypothetical protein
MTFSQSAAWPEAARDGLERGAAYWAMSGWAILAIIIGIIVFAVMGGKP